MDILRTDITAKLKSLVWDADPRELPLLQRAMVQLFRFGYVLVRDMATGQLNLRAMSLVYTTLLSLVPLLAVSFSVLKGFGVHNQIEPVLFNFLQPLGPKGVEVGQRIIEFVENVRVGVLGSIGLALLFYTVISLLQKMEEAFNFVWRVDRLRSLSQRFSNYLSVLLIGPVLIFTALGITASVMNTTLVQAVVAIEPFGTMFVVAGKFVPYLLVIAAFTFVYQFIPNTRVRVGAAAIGGILAGTLWEATGWVFAVFITTSSKYAAIYSSFAILILLLFWLYLSWLILLFGAQISFYVQHPRYLTRQPVRMHMSNRLKEKMALLVMYLVAYNHHYNLPPWTEYALSERIDTPVGPLQRLLKLLVDGGFLVSTAEDPPTYLPARDIETILVTDLVASVREAEESDVLAQDRLISIEPVNEVVDRLQTAMAATLSNQNFKSMVLVDDEKD